uniref:Uncharacterized protein n=1 Tax=Grammatophora oceanica TaxID=210454 RepID=A0A7S1VDZ8_9STRA
MTESSYFHRVNRCGFQVRTAISASVYRKSLRLASSEQQKTTLGELVNLMQVDATKLEAFVPQVHVLWDGMFQIAGYMTILGTLLGWPSLMGLLVMMFAGPVMGKIMGRIYGATRSMVKDTDRRVKTVNEAIQGIRCVKMYTWEESFEKEIGSSRQAELNCLRSVAYLRSFSRAYMSALPAVAAVVTFVVYAYATNRPTTASTLFAALVAFEQLRFPLMFYPMALALLVQAKVSLHRVAIFLGMGEVVTEEGYKREDQSSDVDGGEIIVQDATVYWSDPTIPIPKVDENDEDSKSLERSEHTKEVSTTEMDGSDVAYPKPVVTNLTLHVQPGQLCACIGRVGSGKSSLCSAILNETVLGEGSSITLRGRRVAYAAQSPWILNKTVRDNILFGLPYDEERYEQVIEACQLTHDLAMLDDGDQTEIGERGINLSGGQKQRVSVARAAYSNADVIILDDPLSALDPEVASDLFEACILNFMKGKTRLLVTNQLQCLAKCDTIVALDRGRVIEQGTYDDLMSDDDGKVQQLLKDLEGTSNSSESEKMEETKDKASATKEQVVVVDDGVGAKKVKPDVVANADSAVVADVPKALTSKEEREQGAVRLAVYLKYIRAGGGYFRFAIVYVAFVFCTGLSLLITVSISLWSRDPNYERRSQGFYLGLYALTTVLFAVSTFFRSLLLASFGVKASGVLHKNLLSSILHAPMSFFDTTPTGRILSRFSKDMHSIDQELADYFDFVLFMTLTSVVNLSAIVFVTPWMGIPLIPVIFLYFRILNYFRLVSRETKRLESLSRSPVYSHFSETLGGLSTIRAYGKTDTFEQDFEHKVDENTRAIYCNKTADRWLSVRLELIGATVAGLAAVFATQVVLSADGGTTGTGSNEQFASVAGLSLSYAILITGLLHFVVRTFAALEAAMNSCERVFHYSEEIPQEAAMTSDKLEEDAALAAASAATRTATSNDDDDDDEKEIAPVRAVVASGGKAVHPAGEWPTQGTIVLQNLQMKYRHDTPLVLKGLDVRIKGGERVGVVGRTGSGKSSLLLTLLRIVEPTLEGDPSYEKPPLTIDGVDVLRIGLLELRSKIGIIPQNPVLFSGTIRFNMDPFDEYTDDQIWSALKKCGMYEAVSTMPGELGAPVAEYGENLSQGQRQLLCLGRALLKQCKILMLDEATSSVDFETDREIQRTIREAFVDSTVLTIAHRVNTIMDSDKILVMKDGLAAEFASPEELLSDEASLFADIVRHSKTENGNID